MRIAARPAVLEAERPKGHSRETGVMSTIVELIVTYPNADISPSECIRVLREASLWTGEVSSRKLYMTYPSGYTEIRLESKTPLTLNSKLIWSTVQPRIETVSSDGTRSCVQEAAVVTVSIEKKYMLETQLYIKGGWVHLGYMYPTFDSKEKASEFHHNHYPQLSEMTAETGWKSICSMDDDVRYVVRVHNDEALTLNMRTVGLAAMERSLSERLSK